MNERLQQFAATLVDSTRGHVFVRPEDNLLILRPNKTYHLNATGVEMLGALYAANPLDVDALVQTWAVHYQVPPEQIERDLEALLESLRLMLKGKPGCGPAVRRTPFGTHTIKYPILAEIALTYRCNNRCVFCYASSPDRGRAVSEMNTAQVKQVIDKIVTQAKAPTLSFTGGEPTLRPDLPDLVAYAKAHKLRVNLITNGIRCADAGYVAQLVDAGLDSAQVSLEAADADVHNRIVDNPRAFEQTVQGFRNLKAAGVHTHTNTTICRLNRAHLPALVDFLADEGQEYLSMNMVIRTGGGAVVTADEIGYANIGPLVLALKRQAEARGLRFVWYSPVPYCLFNPAQHGLGSQSCGAAGGLLSVNPAGDVLPCSSFEQGIGSLLRQDFDAIWHTRTARYWRRKEFLPPACRGCDLADLCCGACPLYWDAVGDLGEIADVAPRQAPAWEKAIWQAKRRWIGQAKGVGVQ
ncbi:MAG: PqqD family peptide modification chaperone [Chloroflexi bacterium]|nr:PqqD family peptide modification chaperone [Chloroflexota bacterium]MBU1748542.1 PqqD family peptide modification chaperone [Chloroflexota bacterium]